MNEDSNTLTVEASPRIEVNESEIRKAEQKRSKELVALGAKYNCIDEAQRAIEDGKVAGQFSRWILENNLKTEEPTEVRSDDGEIGLNENEKESYSLVRAIHTFCEKGRFDGLEYEASEAAKKRYGRNSDGLVIPTDVLNHASKRALNVERQTAGGNTVATDLLGASFIDLLRNASVLSQTGATYLNGLQGDVAIPRQSGAATAYWLSGVAAVTDSAQTVDQVTMTPKGLSAQTTFSKQLLAQSSIDIEQCLSATTLRLFWLLLRTWLPLTVPVLPANRQAYWVSVVLARSQAVEPPLLTPTWLTSRKRLLWTTPCRAL